MTRRILGVIGGTGIGAAFANRAGVERVEVDTPFGQPSDAILRAEIDGVECLFLSRHGPGHRFNPSTVPYRANLFALKSLGATHIIATGATGSLREDFAPGELVVCDQVIDKTFRRASTFFDEYIVAHVELADPFCDSLRKDILASAEGIDCRVHDKGTYVCMEGPQFSTRAESHMHRAWGGDLIGMTCMPEAKLAREAEMCYALVALPTDYDCWRPHATDDKQALIREIMANMREASEAAMGLIERAIAHIAKSPFQRCACHDALESAIWSDKESVPAAVSAKLKPLIGRYFQ